MKNVPSYFAVIPADVRYDKNLTLLSRMMYGEITALANKEGYCWANNHYFAELYQVVERTIIRSIRGLEKAGYIRSEIVGSSRKIYLDKIVTIPRQKSHGKHDKNVIHNNTSNKTSNIVKNKNYKDGSIVTLSDGSKALKRFGSWVSPSDFNVKVDTGYYRELKDS